jgi:hypothetical protein
LLSEPQKINVTDGNLRWLAIYSLTIMVPGFCGFQVNIIQFGIDQLADASLSEI